MNVAAMRFGNVTAVRRMEKIPQGIEVSATYWLGGDPTEPVAVTYRAFPGCVTRNAKEAEPEILYFITSKAEPQPFELEGKALVNRAGWRAKLQALKQFGMTRTKPVMEIRLPEEMGRHAKLYRSLFRQDPQAGLVHEVTHDLLIMRDIWERMFLTDTKPSLVKRLFRSK